MRTFLLSGVASAALFLPHLCHAEALLINNKKEFIQEVINSDVPVLLYFFSPGCRPCKTMLPIFDAFADNITDIKVAKINVHTDYFNIASKQEVKGVPVLLGYVNGEIVLRIPGSKFVEKLDLYANRIRVIAQEKLANSDEQTTSPAP